MKKAFLLIGFLWCMTDLHATPLIGLGNPFSFQIDGVMFDDATTSEEKAEWGKRVANGEDPMAVAHEILQRKKMAARRNS